MKIAVIAPLLHYPSRGGSTTDMFETFRIIAKMENVKIIAVRFMASPFERGIFREEPPVPVELIDFETLPDRESFIGRLMEKTSAFAPDVVVIADAWTTKPYLIEEFRKHWLVVARFYAEELICPRNNQRWINERLCDSSAIKDPLACVACSKQYFDFIHNLRNGADNPLTEEMCVSDIFRGDYPSAVSSALSGLNAIVSNSYMKSLLISAGASDVSVVPHGVDTDFFRPPSDTSEHRPAARPFRIMLSGRMDDKSKGLATAIDACKILAEKGLDFELLATASPSSVQDAPPWLKLMGWKSRVEIKDLLLSSDCALVPSICREAFGLTWAEAMATRLPVIASDTPGPLEYITHNVDGLIFPKGDSVALSDLIEMLMKDKSFRERIADAGFRMVNSKLKWSVSAAGTLAALRKAVLPF